MARKLLMNNYVENGLMPVTDGLICWLDGRDGSGQDTIWKDRSRKGNDFELRGFTFSDEDGWTGNNLKVNFGQVAIKENFSLPEEYTIEADLFVDGVKYTEQSTCFYFGDGAVSGKWRELTFRRDRDDLQIMYNNITISIPRELKRYNLIMQGTRGKIYLYVDNVKIYERECTNVLSGLTANFYLGCGHNLHRYCKARFNSVRVYNRILTEEEINHNYQYDQSIKRINDSSELDFDWDYDKKSDIPVSIRNLCSEYCVGPDIKLNVFSDEQILELDLCEVKYGNNDPQIMLLSSNNTGGKVYWDANIGVLKMSNNPSFDLQLNYPCKLKVTLIDGIFSLYIDGVLKTSTKACTSEWLTHTGMQFLASSRDLIVTGFRYKNFKKGKMICT